MGEDKQLPVFVLFCFVFYSPTLVTELVATTAYLQALV